MRADCLDAHKSTSKEPILEGVEQLRHAVHSIKTPKTSSSSVWKHTCVWLVTHTPTGYEEPSTRGGHAKQAHTWRVCSAVAQHVLVRLLNTPCPHPGRLPTPASHTPRVHQPPRVQPEKVSPHRCTHTRLTAVPTQSNTQHTHCGTWSVRPEVRPCQQSAD